MSAFLTHFHFLRPWWLLLAVLWVPAGWWWGHRQRAGHALQRLVDAPLMAHVTTTQRVGRTRLTRLLPWAGAVLATLALAGPTWSRLPQTLYRQGAAQAVVVSLSPRMLATDIKPDRMRRVRYKVHDLLHANAAGSNALVAYAGDAFVVAPLSADAHALDELVNALSPQVMPSPGDDAAAGIRRGARLLNRAGHAHGQLVVVADTADRAARDAARTAHRKGVRLSVLGVGATGTTPVRLPDGQLLRGNDGKPVMATRDDAALRALAAAGGGIYVPMTSDGSDIAALRKILHAPAATSGASRHKVNRWQDMGPWLLLPLLAVVALGFRRGWLLLAALALLPLTPSRLIAADTPPASHRTTSADGSWWWRNGDQRAVDALDAGDPARARGEARSPGLRGTAALRAGDPAAAVHEFSRVDSADGWYNRGNALAAQKHYSQALKAWDEALRRDPHMHDARSNRKAVQAWLEKQQEKSGGRRGKQDGKGAHAGANDAPGAAGDKQGHTPKPGAKGASSLSRNAAGKPDDGQGAQGRQGETRQRHVQRDDPRPAPAGSAAAPSAPRHPRDPARAASATSAPVSAPSFDLGKPAPATAASALPAPMEKALQRVRDDPGGLLRRKFELEYRQRRHDAEQRGDAP